MRKHIVKHMNKLNPMKQLRKQSVEESVDRKVIVY